MKSIREILRLHYSCGFSRKKIKRLLGVSRAAISDYLKRAEEAGIGWPLPDELDDNELENLLFPKKETTVPARPKPDCSYIHQERRKKHVTLTLLWLEYKEQNPDGYQYTQFCDYYRDWAKKLNLSMKQIHLAGQKCFSDFAGDTIPIYDQKTGTPIPVRLFVATLGASNYTFARAYPDETSRSWCTGQAAAFQRFGGVTELVVPDNPRAVVNKPCRYEPEIHPDFQYMAEYHDTAVIPARVRKPKDKAKVETGVLMVERWILAALRNQKFFSLGDLNEKIDELVDKLNEKPFKKLPGCRRTLFEQIDKPALKQLPKCQYEYTKILQPRVNIDYHIQVDDVFYSVPHQLSQEEVYVRMTPNIVEVFFKGKRVTSHVRSYIKYSKKTLDEHMPEGIRQFKNWNPTRIVNWAAKTGPATAKLVGVLMSKPHHPEQAFRSCMGIIRLGERYSKERLEKACQLALDVNAHSYKSVARILSTNGDKRLSEQSVQLKIVHDNLRGAEYYRENFEQKEV